MDSGIVPNPTLFGRIEWAFELVETTPIYVPMAVPRWKTHTTYSFFERAKYPDTCGWLYTIE